MPRREARDGDMSDHIDIKVFILFLLDELRYPLNETVIAEMVHEREELRIRTEFAVADHLVHGAAGLEPLVDSGVDLFKTALRVGAQ